MDKRLEHLKNARKFWNNPKNVSPGTEVLGFPLWGPAHINAFKDEYPGYLSRVRGWGIHACC